MDAARRWIYDDVYGHSAVVGPLFTVVNLVPFLGALVEKGLVGGGFCLCPVAVNHRDCPGVAGLPSWIGLALLGVAVVVFGLVIGGWRWQRGGPRPQTKTAEVSTKRTFAV